ncbi:MAG: 4-hydroxybenzoate octaprenyltransferase [Sphingopyxis sp.]
MTISPNPPIAPVAPTPPIAPPDTQGGMVLRLLPAAARPFALLARFDRPIGWWLLFWPCGWGVALAGGGITHWHIIAWMLLGAIAMRGAGCVYNDIIDRDLDRQVERTRSRPLASGAVSARAAWLWLLALCAIGLLVLFQLPRMAQWVALGSVAPVAAYPFMKRITWWPQAWLGLVFSWGALVGWCAVVAGAGTAGGAPSLWALALLYTGSIGWVIGYDTIYALQDVEDDALVGIKSSARAMGARVRRGVAIFYALAIAALAGGVWMVRPDPLALAALLPAAAHMAWQVATVDPANGQSALHRFRANRFTGFLLFLAFLVVGSTA